MPKNYIPLDSTSGTWKKIAKSMPNIQKGSGVKQYFLSITQRLKIQIIVTAKLVKGNERLKSILTNSMAYGTRRFNAAFTRALQ